MSLKALFPGHIGLSVMIGTNAFQCNAAQWVRARECRKEHTLAVADDASFLLAETCVEAYQSEYDVALRGSSAHSVWAVANTVADCLATVTATAGAAQGACGRGRKPIFKRVSIAAPRSDANLGALHDLDTACANQLRRLHAHMPELTYAQEHAHASHGVPRPHRLPAEQCLHGSWSHLFTHVQSPGLVGPRRSY